MMPSSSRKLPFFYIEGEYFTPEEILEHIEAETEIGKKAIQQLTLGRLSEDKNLAKYRIIQRMQQLPPDIRLFPTWSCPTCQGLTPSEIIQHVYLEDEIGQRMIKMQQLYIEYLTRLFWRAFTHA